MLTGDLEEAVESLTPPHSYFLCHRVNRSPAPKDDKLCPRGPKQQSQVNVDWNF